MLHAKIISTEENSGYLAGPGWDPVTGLGTPIADNLTVTLTGGVSCISVPEFPFAQVVLVLSIASLIVLYNVKPLNQN
jgi:hypothetical protein